MRLAKRVVTASSGWGERGTFGVTVTFKQPRSGERMTLYAYEPSAQDGGPLHEMRIPLVAL